MIKRSYEEQVEELTRRYLGGASGFSSVLLPRSRSSSWEPIVDC